MQCPRCKKYDLLHSQSECDYCYIDQAIRDYQASGCKFVFLNVVLFNLYHSQFAGRYNVLNDLTGYVNTLSKKVIVLSQKFWQTPPLDIRTLKPNESPVEFTDKTGRYVLQLSRIKSVTQDKFYLFMYDMKGRPETFFPTHMVALSCEMRALSTSPVFEILQIEENKSGISNLIDFVAGNLPSFSVSNTP